MLVLFIFLTNMNALSSCFVMRKIIVEKNRGGIELKSLRKSMTVAATATLCLSGLLASTSGAFAASTSGKPTSGPVTLTIMSWNVAEATLQKDATLFHKIHPNVTFKFVNEASPTFAYTKLNAELAAGSGLPDIVSIESSHAQSFLGKFPNSFLNMTQADQPLKKDFAPSKWSALTGTNGQIYGIPWDIGPAMMFYRRDLFKQAGINPNAIKTWDQYIAAGQKLVKHFNGKIKMTAVNYDDDGVFKMMTNEQGAFYFNNKGQITVSSPAALKAVAMEQKMVKAGIGLQVPSANGWNDTIAAFTNNQIASVAMGVWYVGTIETSAPKQNGKWGVFPLPAFTPSGSHAANLGGSNLMISAGTQHPKTAMEFAKFAMTNTAALNASMSYGIFPSYIPYFSSSVFKQGLPFFAGQNVFKMAADEAKLIKPENHTSDFAASTTYVDNAIQSVLNNQMSVSAAMKQAASQIAHESGRTIVN